MASGRMSPGMAADVVRDGRVDDAAWARVRPEQQIREVEAARPKTEAAALRRIDYSIAALLEADDTYWAATEIAAAASDGLTLSVPAGYQFSMWSELTDWYEHKPDEDELAVAAMRRAAADWLIAKNDAEERESYFKKWLSE